jgi:hypothetical protein
VVGGEGGVEVEDFAAGGVDQDGTGVSWRRSRWQRSSGGSCLWAERAGEDVGDREEFVER